MAEEQGSKTEPGTPQARRKARERGHVARSTELVSALLLGGMLLLLFGMQAHTSQGFTRLFVETIGKAEQHDISISGVMKFYQDQAIGLIAVLLPFLLGSIIIALVANWLQVGFLFTTKPLEPDPSKLSPVKGFQRMFSGRSVFELFKGLLKILLVGSVAVVILQRAAPEIMATLLMLPQDGLVVALSIALRLALYAAVLLLVLALLDYIYQRYEFEKSIRMSKQEIRQEFKNMEGDPQIKRRIRELGRKIVMNRMMQNLQTADAVITNPTHYAVALRYELDWPAPKVVAKGKDYNALRLIRAAEQLGLPVHQQPELARALYKTELDEFVPAALFRTVAQVLAHIAKSDAALRRKLRGVQHARFPQAERTTG
jgi:flagellar biosynthetic protein FlhB